MNEREAHVVHLHDRHGQLYGVLLSPQVWAAVQHKVAPLLEQALEKMYPTARPEPMDDWQMFKDYWDFKYPFCADVHCDCCGAPPASLSAAQRHPQRDAGLRLREVWRLGAQEALQRPHLLRIHARQPQMNTVRRAPARRTAFPTYPPCPSRRCGLRSTTSLASARYDSAPLDLMS